MSEFRPFEGELLVSPCPGQIVLNYCSGGCLWCFANLRLGTGTRDADEIRISNFLRDFHRKKSFTARLLQEKYVWLCSNLVDFFAASNYYLGVKILETMTALDIPVAIQTRGKFGIDDALGFLKPSHWYISIGTVREKLREQMEPGASTIAYRLDIINRLREKGHRVAVGINPIVPEWLNHDEADWLLDELASRGVEGIWTAVLHLDNVLVANMSEKDKAFIGDDIMYRSRCKSTTAEEESIYQHVAQGAKARGMSWYEGPISEPSNYWKPFQELYPKRFPVIQTFVNWCFANKPEYPLSFEDFYTILLSDGSTMLDGVWKTREYVRSINNALAGNIPERLTFEQILRVMWSEYTLNRSLLNLDCFALWIQGDELVVDEQNLPYYWFTDQPGGWGNNFSIESENIEEITSWRP